MLAVGELLVSAKGRVSVWALRAGCSMGWLCPFQFGNSRRPAEFVWRAQTIWAPLEMIVGFVKLQFDRSTKVSMTGGAASPIGAVVSMRG